MMIINGNMFSVGFSQNANKKMEANNTILLHIFSSEKKPKQT